MSTSGPGLPPPLPGTYRRPFPLQFLSYPDPTLLPTNPLAEDSSLLRSRRSSSGSEVDAYFQLLIDGGSTEDLFEFLKTFLSWVSINRGAEDPPSMYDFKTFLEGGHHGLRDLQAEFLQMVLKSEKQGQRDSANTEGWIIPNCNGKWAIL